VIVERIYTLRTVV